MPPSPRISIEPLKNPTGVYKDIRALLDTSQLTNELKGQMGVRQLSRTRYPGALCSLVVWFMLEIKEEAFSYYPSHSASPE